MNLNCRVLGLSTLARLYSLPLGTACSCELISGGKGYSSKIAGTLPFFLSGYQFHTHPHTHIATPSSTAARGRAWNGHGFSAFTARWAVTGVTQQMILVVTPSWCCFTFTQRDASACTCRQDSTEANIQ